MKKSILITLLIAFSVAAGIYGITLSDVLSSVNDTFEVKSAMLTVEKARRELAALNHAGSSSLSVDPTVKSTSTEQGSFGEAIEISALTALKIPVGLSSLEKEKAGFAANALTNAERALKSAREKALIKLYSQFQAAWLAQEQLDVLAAELDSARAFENIMRKNFEAGGASLLELAVAEEDLEEKQEAFFQGNLERRLTWLELSYTAGLARDTGTLEQSRPDVADLARPPELSSWLYDHNPSILLQKTRIREIQESIDRLAGVDLSLDLKTFLNTEDHSASLSYNFSSPEITAAYSFPLYSWGEIPTGSGSSVSTWSTGLTLGLTIEGSRADNLNIASLSVEHQLEEEKLNALLETLNLEIRTAFQQWLKAGDSLEQAQRNLERAEENQKIVKTKKTIGQAAEYEILEAASLVKRSQWKLESAFVDVEKARMAAADAASYLSEIYLIAE